MTDSFTHVMNGAQNVKCLNVIDHVEGTDPICDCMEFGEV